MLFKNLDEPIVPNPDNEWALTGYGAVTKNLDRVGDVIAPGGFPEKTLHFFLQKGFIANQHDWTTPIGKPKAALEDAKGLWFDSTIIDTTAGTDAHKLMKAGVLHSLSIGYDIEEWEPWDLGLLKSIVGDPTVSAMSNREIENTLFWGKYIKTVYPVYEISVVSVPANEAATITGVKDVSSNNLALGLRSGLPLMDNESAVRAMATECMKLAKRWEGLIVRRKEERRDERALSENNRERIESFVKSVEASMGEMEEVTVLLKSLLQETPAGPALETPVSDVHPVSDDEAEMLYASFVRIKAQYLLQ